MGFGPVCHSNEPVENGAESHDHGGAAGRVRVREFDLVSRGEEAVRIQSLALDPVPLDRVLVYAHHATYPGFRAFGVFDADRLAGFGYAAQSLPGQWWHDQIRPALVAAGQARWLEDAYAVIELHLLPEYHGRGIGRALLTSLLRAAPYHHALLSTYDEDTRARALYRRLGFVDLVTGFRFLGQSQEYALMGAALPLRDQRALPD